MSTTVPTAQPIKILIAKTGLDGHDRGAKVLARALMDEGFEVIYTGIRKTAEQVAKIALQEDVDVIGLSSLSGAHNQTFGDVADELSKLGIADKLLIGGGVIPDSDIAALKAKGFAEIFTPGTPIANITAFIRLHVNGAA